MSSKRTSIWKSYFTPTKLRLNDSTWDDLRFPATAINPHGTSSDPSFDVSNIGYTFTNGSTNVLYIVGQFPHKWLGGSIIVPHVHWTQSQSGTPKWQMKYKWIANGYSIPTTFTTITTTVNEFSYSSGSIMQMSNFEEISPPFIADDKALSSVIKIELSRLGGDTEDTYDADLLFSEFDIHFQADTIGSFEQFKKYG